MGMLHRSWNLLPLWRRCCLVSLHASYVRNFFFLTLIEAKKSLTMFYHTLLTFTAKYISNRLRINYIYKYAWMKHKLLHSIVSIKRRHNVIWWILFKSKFFLLYVLINEKLQWQLLSPQLTKHKLVFPSSIILSSQAKTSLLNCYQFDNVLIYYLLW
jgi:hypothetical protein